MDKSSKHEEVTEIIEIKTLEVKEANGSAGTDQALEQWNSQTAKNAATIFYSRIVLYSIFRQCLP